MRVLVACEFSGAVRDAFIRAGHDAMSCDLLDTERPGPHYQGDVRDVLDDGWDIMVAHPPCTDLAVSGARWFKEKGRERQDAAIEFVRLLLAAPIPRIAVENPVSVISSMIRRPDQIIQPWQFGHPETKATCLWLKNLPPLRPTNPVEPEFIISRTGRKMSPTHFMGGGLRDQRGHERSRTFEGIAEAMARQWGNADLPLQLDWTAA